MQSTKNRSTERRLRTALREITPSALLRERAVILRLGAKAGPIYARLRLLDSLGLYAHNKSQIRPNAKSFLFVCFGNIMRSPMAEALFRKSIREANPDVCACSAGTHAVAGNLPDSRALAVSEEMGASLAEHRAQPLTARLVEQADAIFAMDFQNKAELLTRYPEHREKIHLLSAYGDGAQRYREIADPYSGDLETTRACHAYLQICIRNLTAELIRR
jgi:protein-tyrosine phosphatase